MRFEEFVTEYDHLYSNANAWKTIGSLHAVFVEYAPPTEGVARAWRPARQRIPYAVHKPHGSRRRDARPDPPGRS